MRYSLSTRCVAGSRLNLAWGLAVAGHDPESRKVLEAGLKEHPEQDFRPVRAAQVNVALGEMDPDFSLLDRAYEAWSPNLVYVIAGPEWDRLLSDSRFQALAEEIGVPQNGRSRHG